MRDLGMVLVCGACLLACGGDDSSTGDDVVQPDASTGDPDAAGSASVTMHVLNGPTPAGAARPTHGVAHATSGNWQISPDELHATLLGLGFFGAGVQNITLTDCQVAFELAEPGLAQQVDCAFTLPAGSYVGVSPVWSSEYQVLIDDAANGIFTDPASGTKLSGTAPGGGAAMITVGTPGMMMGSGAQFDPPLVVEDGQAITVSILLNALQSFQINVNGATLSLGADGNGLPGFPDAVVAIGTPAAVGYYVNDTLGTPLSFSYANPALTNIVTSVAVLQGSDQQPEFLSQRGSPTECPSGAQFFFPGAGNGYVGLDTSGVLGWAGYTGSPMTYQALYRMAAVDMLDDTTTLECAATSTDPMPSGDSFASGAPTFTAARTFAMTLMAN